MKKQLDALQKLERRLYMEMQEILEGLYPLGLSIRREVDLPNGMTRVSYLLLTEKDIWKY
jgi:hypothetical protein